MEKQSYLKPFMVMEKFKPQEFVALCDVPQTTYMLSAPGGVETDGTIGWSNKDSKSYNSTDYRFYFNETPTITWINKDTYSGDNHNGYYEFKFTSPLIVVHYNRYSQNNKYERLQDATVFTSQLGRILYYSSTNSVSNNNATNTHS